MASAQTLKAMVRIAALTLVALPLMAQTSTHNMVNIGMIDDGSVMIDLQAVKRDGTRRDTRIYAITSTRKRLDVNTAIYTDFDVRVDCKEELIEQKGSTRRHYGRGVTVTGPKIVSRPMTTKGYTSFGSWKAVICGDSGDAFDKDKRFVGDSSIEQLVQRRLDFEPAQ